MVTDLRYAMGQLCRARDTHRAEVRKDALSRCQDALERCLESAERLERAVDLELAEALEDEVDEDELERLFGDEVCYCGGHKATCLCEHGLAARGDRWTQAEA